MPFFLAPLLGSMLAPMLGPALASAGIGAGLWGAGATGLGALAGSALLPAAGAGIASLLTGSSGKEALQNAAMGGLAGGIGGLAGGVMKGANAASAGGIPSAITTSTLPGATDALTGAFVPAAAAPAVNAIPEVAKAKLFEQPIKWATQNPLKAAVGAGLVSDMFAPKWEGSPKWDGAVDPYTFDDFEGGGDYADMYTGQRFRTYDDLLDFRTTRGYADGGAIQGPGTGTSDSIPAMIYQDGQPVQKAALSNGEHVITAKQTKNAGGHTVMDQMQAALNKKPVSGKTMYQALNLIRRG